MPSSSQLPPPPPAPAQPTHAANAQAPPATTADPIPAATAAPTSTNGSPDSGADTAPRGRQGPQPRGGRGWLWPLLVRLHFYAGVFIAPFLVVSALTGLAFTLTPTLDGYVYDAYLHPARVEGSPLPLVEQVRAARLVNPEGTIAAIQPPDRPDATTKVILNLPELGEKQRTVYVDPYSGRVRGDLITWFDETPLMTWFDDLHRNLHLGVVGRHYSELAASWLWVLVGGGVVLWLGRPRTYRGDRWLGRILWPDPRARGVRRSRGWHASIGLWLAVGLLILSATGLTWSRYAGAKFTAVLEDLQAHAPQIDATLPNAAAPAPGAAGEAADGGHGEHGVGGGQPATDLPAGIDVDRVAATARAAGLRDPFQVSPPADQTSGWTAREVDNRWPIGRDQVAIDPTSGQVFASNPWADYPLLAKLSTLGIQAHMGLLFGPVNQLVLAAIAIGLLTAIFYGYRMWWQRRPTHNRNGQRNGQPNGQGNGQPDGQGNSHGNGHRNGDRADRRAPLRLGRPPARGAWREVPWALLIPGIVVVAAVGWVLPMFGLSLLAFLLVDGVIGVLGRRRDRTAPPVPEPRPR
jgi:uncharacterized iron-regulated membrane protein